MSTTDLTEVFGAPLRGLRLGPLLPDIPETEVDEASVNRLRNACFDTHRVKEGYDTDEVDDYIDRAMDVIDTLLEEDERLRTSLTSILNDPAIQGTRATENLLGPQPDTTSPVTRPAHPLHIPVLPK